MPFCKSSGIFRDMPIHLSDRQLDRIDRGREPALIVRSDRTKRGYAVIKQDVYDQVQPLLSAVATQIEVSPRENGHAVEWTETKNVRRVELITKKHDQGLTAAEKKELAVLVSEAAQFRDRTVPVGNDILELILAGLKQQVAKKARR